MKNIKVIFFSYSFIDSIEKVKLPLNEKDVNNNFAYDYMENLENYINSYGNPLDNEEKNRKKRYEYLYDLVNKREFSINFFLKG